MIDGVEQDGILLGMNPPTESDLTDFGAYGDDPDGTVATVLLQDMNAVEPLN